MMRGLLMAMTLLVGASATAQTVYVTDILRLGLHQAADTSDRPFESLVSGAPLEVLESTTNYARVRTADGLEGWVKSAYLVDEKPAQLRVAELEGELAALREEHAKLRDAHLSAQEEASRLGKEIAASVGSTDSIQETMARLKRDNEAYEARLESYRGALPLTWVGAALVVALVAGFLAGLWWLDALIRRRHGGFRIY